MCSFFSLCKTKSTHQGHFITRHVSPMCYSTKIDQKSSAVELCIIKVNIFYADADSLNKKSNAQWRDGNNAIVNEDGLSDRSWRSYLGMFMNKDFSMYSQHWFSYSVTFGARHIKAGLTKTCQMYSTVKKDDHKSNQYKHWRFIANIYEVWRITY